MIVLPSRGRPHNFRRLVDACLRTKTTDPAVVRLDHDDETLQGYLEVELPDSWKVVVGNRLPLSGIYNEVYSAMSEAKHWIFIADDVVPLTDSWDVKLAEVAGSDGMAVPSGGHDPSGAPHFVLGGDLVREIGWLSLPGLDRLYIDTVWQKIAEERGVLRRVPDVVLEHRHFSNKKARIDATYLKHRKTQDKLIYDNWRQNVNFS